MADYGVPEHDDGLLPWTWAEQRLRESRNYWISHVDASGAPHATPVWGVWLPGIERFWFSCAPTSAKARNLAERPDVVVAPTDTVEVVSLEGRAEPAGDANAGAAIDAYFAKYGEEMGTTKEELAAFHTENAAFEVVPRRAFGIIETPEDFGPRATRWRWP